MSLRNEESESTPILKCSKSVKRESDIKIKKNGLSWRTKIFYSVGHIYNDLCASIWFSYTLLYFQLQFESKLAAGLLLLGQVTDALATPLIGFQSDRDSNHWLCRYGKRKSWHLLGTILVTGSFPFIFNVCIACQDSSPVFRFLYYSLFIGLFQIGWSAVQVAHVSLITDLTPHSKERIELNAYRQACTVGASICVYTITLLALGVNGDATINKDDSSVFTNVAYIVCGIGIVYSLLFHIFVKEPDTKATQFHTENQYTDDLSIVDHNYSEENSVISSPKYGTIGTECRCESLCRCKGCHQRDHESGERIQMTIECTTGKCDKMTINDNKWSDWLRSFDFYKVGFIYMMSRFYVNLTQVYTPLYLQDTLKLPKRSIAIIPFVTYVSGLIFSLIIKPISSKIGSKVLLIIGCAFGLASCIWINFGGYNNAAYKLWQIYGVSLFFGIGGTTMLIASLAITADLIGTNAKSGAFVFGAMSFLDKMLNGGAVVILEQFNPKLMKVNATDVTGNDVTPPLQYYQQILSFVSGSAVIMTLIGLAMLWRTNFGISLTFDCENPLPMNGTVKCEPKTKRKRRFQIRPFSWSPF